MLKYAERTFFLVAATTGSVSRRFTPAYHVFLLSFVDVPIFMPLSTTERSTIESHLKRTDCTLDDLIKCIDSIRFQRQSASPALSHQHHTNAGDLPDKAIALILRHAVENDFNTPLRLSAVCQSWRNVALETPHLWTKITILSTKQLGKAATYLERSYPLSVSLHITFFNNPLGQRERSTVTQTLVPQLSNRCQAFHLESAYAEPFHLIIPTLASRSALKLVSFHLTYVSEYVTEDWIWGEWRGHAFGNNAPTLKEVALTGLPPPWKTFNVPGLTVFCFDFTSSDVLSSLQAFHGIISASKETLQVLTILQDYSETISIHHSWMSYDNPGKASNNPRKSTGNGPPFSRVDLPSLLSLSFSFTCAELACDLISTVFSCPSIKSLTLESIRTDASKLLSAIVDSPFTANLTTLRLLDLPSVAPGRMLHFLRDACANVTLFSLQATHSVSLKEVPFLMRWMATEREEYLIPNLRELHCSGIHQREVKMLVETRSPSNRLGQVVVEVKESPAPDDPDLVWLTRNVGALRVILAPDDDEHVPD